MQKLTKSVFHPIPKRFLICSGSVLKMVAIVTMLIDHLGAGIVYPMLMGGLTVGSLSREQSILLYSVMRIIGRTAFPIFCFLLVEGFFHTGNKMRYCLNLFAFSLISEIPFDLALIPGNELTHTLQIPAALSHNLEIFSKDQNVYFTLWIGFCVIWAVDSLMAKAAQIAKERVSLQTPARIWSALFACMIIGAGSLCANLLYTDYDHKGILLIVAFYLCYRIRPLALCAGYVYISWAGYNEVFSLPGFLLMALYNGKRGFIRGRLKYVFYAFYPVHLFLIYVLRTFLM